jgi:hypothetical protein
MVNQVHENSVIGIKRLTSSDLGFANNGVTHIGLFKDTFNFLDISERRSLVSTLIYQNSTFDLLSIFDPITRADGTLDAPKIRKGDGDELIVGNVKMDSVVRQVRRIAETNVNTERYLLWFGLDTDELVYLLFDRDSNDFSSITGIIGRIDERKIKIGNNIVEFRLLIQFLNSKVETVNFEYYEELEVASQTGSISTSKRVIPRVRDIAKANKLFKETGIKGEELLYQYFERQKSISTIKDFKWMNQSMETGMPYDFEITNLDNSIVFSDAKSTSYKFELPIILSFGELNFINDNRNHYLIHRLYSINETPKMRVCSSINFVSDIFIPNYDIFNQSLITESFSIRSPQLAVSPSLLSFQEPILL